MKSFIYTGPLSGVSLKDCGDVMLVPGSTVQLPAENYYTERLARKGWLQEIPAQEIQPETVQNTIEQEPAPAPDKKRRK